MEKITRNGFEITVTDNVNEWFAKADKLRLINDKFYHISRSVEEWGTYHRYVQNKKFKWPAIVGKKLRNKNG